MPNSRNPGYMDLFYILLQDSFHWIFLKLVRVFRIGNVFVKIHEFKYCFLSHMGYSIR